MSEQGTSSHLAIAAAIVIAGVLISASLFVAVGQAKTTTETTVTTSVSTSTQTITTTPAVANSVVYSQISDGIQLGAVIQPDSDAAGQNFTITAIVRDVLATPVQLNGTGVDNPVYGPCAQDFATGVNVYPGRYTSANVSQASPLQLYNPSLIYTCPTESMLHYSLDSGEAITESYVISGYWTGSVQNYTYTALPPGFYTAAVFDAWDQTAIGYIQVYPITAAIDYLVANYNPAVGLIPETSGSHTYWLYSDNFLAALALSQYGGNATTATIAANISKTVNRDLALNGAENQYMALTSGLCEFPPALNFTVPTSGGVQIKVVLNNGTGAPLSENQYADIAFLNAVCLHRQGNVTGALTAYTIGRNMFDGVGFRDLPYNETGQYQTYKLALFIYASVVLDQPVSSAALSTLLAMQASDGGFYTGYNASYSQYGTQTNTETTSLAILALSSIQNG